ncbi:hypothetical protein DV738_g3635, partial [Chaetothyriales sp. CBS 135597]
MNGQDSNGPSSDDKGSPASGFSLAHQKVELDLDFSEYVTGRTEIVIFPKSPSLKFISLNSRSCRVKNVKINGLSPASISHQDPCSQLSLHFDATINQHHILTKKIARSCEAVPQADLVIGLPPKLKIQRVDQEGATIRIPPHEADGKDSAATTQALTDASDAEYTPLTISMDFATDHISEAVQFVSGTSGSGKWPHLYTRGTNSRAISSAIFPCVDVLRARCTWDIAITCPRTVGDAIIQRTVEDKAGRLALQEKLQKQTRPAHELREMVVICSGKMVDENIVKNDSTKKTVSFSCLKQLSAQQIGFAVGPFERINLNALREADEIAKLGENAVDISAYCLPGRGEEAKNTCLPLTWAVDTFVTKYMACPAQSFAVCFVEEAGRDTAVFAHTAMCSTRLLYPESVIDTSNDVTRKLVHTIAAQWSGIDIIPETRNDTWAVVGVAYFITDLFMRELCGTNEYRYQMKLNADRVFELDRERPSIYDMGSYLHIDPSGYEFLALKAPVVLFVLDRRMAKAAGASKMPNIIGRIFQRARQGDMPNNTLSTEFFQKTVERFAHFSINEFMEQWVKGAGCPKFQAFQKFNKKKLVIEMQIKQVHAAALDRDLQAGTFMRDVREDWEEVFAGEVQPVFTGPMTIRIHEADGTPYEHIVQIKDRVTNIDIPYNTKYKRLKRSKQQRKSAPGRGQAEGDEESDALVYCLGDTLQSEEDIKDWKIREWTQEDEERMNAESYEWIRLDADFEWITQIELNLPGYMFASQLQQDRDVVAQMYALERISIYSGERLVSSILVRTLVDRRYFYGIRQLAAKALVRHATEEKGADYIGLFHLQKSFESMYCVNDSGSAIPRPNDFSDRQAYTVQCSIIEAFSKIRDSKGYTPHRVKEFLLDKLRYNDNSSNEYSDAFYIATVMRSLTTALLARSTRRLDADDIGVEEATELNAMHQFEKQCVEEIDRYRRMDEWTSSFQNLYCRTALQCQARLAEAGIIKFSPLHFMQYTRPGNYDMLRMEAFNILATQALFEDAQAAVLEYMVNCMVVSSSSYIRQGIQAAFGRVLAGRAMGLDHDGIVIDDDPAEATDLVLEERTNMEAAAAKKEAAKARRQNVEAAQEALMKELGEYPPLKRALWAAITYPQIRLEDMAVMLDFARMLYPAENKARLTLKYPRYWRVQKVGKGKLKFTHNGSVRTKRMEKWRPLKAGHAPVPSSGLKLKFTNKAAAQSKSPSAAKPTPPLHPPGPSTLSNQAHPGRVVLKIGRSNASKS